MPFTKADKERNWLFAMKFLTNKGWTDMQAAAIVGNLTAESYMNPETPRGDAGTAMGLAQWRGDRLAKFEEIIGKHCEDSSLEEQLTFVDWEFRNTHRKAQKMLLGAVTIEDATHYVDKFYERSAGKHLERRVKFAKEALELYHKSLLDKLLEKQVVHSMDASDPPTIAQPHAATSEPVPSSGFPEATTKPWYLVLIEYIKGRFNVK